MGYDPDGTWNWSAFWKGLGRIALGVGAVVAGGLVLASGVAGIAMLAVAAVTVAAGVATTVNGVADIGEAATDYNFVRDWIFDGNEDAYNVFSTVTDTVSYVGSIVCGGWLKANGPRIKAYKNIENYSMTNKVMGHTDRAYNNSLLLQKEIIKYGKMSIDSFGYVFSINGTVNGSNEKLWRLGVNIAKQLIWHFGHGF